MGVPSPTNAAEKVFTVAGYGECVGSSIEPRQARQGVGSRQRVVPGEWLLMRLGGRQVDHHLAAWGHRTCHFLPRNPREAPPPAGTRRADRVASMGRKNERNLRSYLISSSRLFFLGTVRWPAPFSHKRVSVLTCPTVTSACNVSRPHCQFRRSHPRRNAKPDPPPAPQF